MIMIKTGEEIEKMAIAGQITAQALSETLAAVKPGVTTKRLNDIAHAAIIGQGAIPAFLNYNGFPASACISINDEIVHGIPSEKRVLHAGDIVSVDVGAIFEGYVGDTADTVPVGEISAQAKELIDTTRASFYAGFAQCREGKRLHDISAAIQAVAEEKGYGVVRQFVGHGIGTKMHEEPSVPNYGTAGKGPRLVKGMVIAIEPMINIGTYMIRVMPDGWTAKTADGSLSAHYEHTVAITSGEPRILTARDER